MIRAVSLYNGTVNIEFDPDKHYYHLVGSNAKPDGVTTILELIPKFLLNWAAGCAVDHIHAGILERLAGEGAVETTFLASLCDEARKAWRTKRDTAGNTGKLVHAFAEEIIGLGAEWGEHVEALIEETPNAAHAGCLAFCGWWNSVGQLEQVPGENQDKAERIVFSRRLFYAGTCDLFAMQHGRPTVFDFKTSSGFYDSQPLQLAGYAMAIEEEREIEIKDGWIIHIDKETGKCTPYHVEITPELKTDWEAVRIAWRAVKRNQERHKEIKSKCRQSTNITQAAVAR